jgi:4-hydroxy-tetrahydrodipicolinate reductase
MGKEIEKIAIQRGHTIDLTIDIDNVHDLNSEKLSKVDVAIDFAIPESAYENIMKCFEGNTPVVSGTTGWLDKYDEVIHACKSKNQSFFYAPNYSLGVNIFKQVNKYLAKMMNSLGQYEVSMEEIHHTQKLDAPSGTAISLAEDVLEEVERKDSWELDKQSKSSALKIIAKREGTVPGTHIINYDSDVDYIEICHVAKSRKGFALGAVLAAEFLSDKKGVYGMNDMLNLK